MQVTGSGFGASEVVNLTDSNGALSGSADTGGSGSFTTSAVVAAGAQGGSDVVTATGTTSADSAQATFIVAAPAVSLASASASLGERVTISGTGFAPNESSTILVADGALLAQPATTDASGAFTTTAVPVACGPFYVGAEDTSGDISAQGPILTITCPVVDPISPGAAPPGGTVGVTVSGFYPGGEASAVLAWGGYGPCGGGGSPLDRAQLFSGIPVDGSGNLSTSVVLPLDAEGGCVTVREQVEVSGSQYTFSAGPPEFTNLPNLSVDGPTISTSPYPIAPGETVTVAGSGFGAGDSIVITDADNNTLATTTASSAGGFANLSVVIPAGSSDTYIVATDQQTGISTAGGWCVGPSYCMTASP